MAELAAAELADRASAEEAHRASEASNEAEANRRRESMLAR